MTTIRAHFDGRVFVPDEPVALPKDKAVELQFRELADGRPRKRTSKLPVFRPKPGTPPIRSEDVYAAEDEV